MPRTVTRVSRTLTILGRADAHGAGPGGVRGHRRLHRVLMPRQRPPQTHLRDSPQAVPKPRPASMGDIPTAGAFTLVCTDRSRIDPNRIQPQSLPPGGGRFAPARGSGGGSLAAGMQADSAVATRTYLSADAHV